MREKHFVIVLWIMLTIADSSGIALAGYTDYIPGHLGNRPIFWCPSGYGYGAYCPQPTDDPTYTWCCTWPSNGIHRVSCCPFAVPLGMLVALIFAGIVVAALLTFLTCWCCYLCPLYQRMVYGEQYEIIDQEEQRFAEKYRLKYDDHTH